MKSIRALTAWLLACVGCGPGHIGGGGGDAGEEVCAPGDNTPPAAPVVVSPRPGRIDVVPAELVVATSAFSDADGDAHGESEFELWTTGGGVRVERIWRARVTDAGKLTTVTLADGVFEGSGADGLDEWTPYLVRARHRDADPDCPAWSDWSGDVAFRTDDGSTYLFDPTQIRTFYLDIPPESWGPIDAEAIPPGCVPWRRSYYRGTLRFEGQVLDGVGVHIKGGCGSARNLSGKPSFKVNLEWDDPAVAGCPAERRLHGEKHFTFNNMVQDPTQSHEMLGYPLYRDLGVPAPRAAYVKLYVNDEYWGVYTHVETVDRRFLERSFASKGGMLYEGTYWCDLVPGNVPPDDDDGTCLTREFSPDACESPELGWDPLTYDLLRQLVNQIEALPPGGFYPEVEAFFDYDRFLTTWAIESFIAHWDAYEFDILNNYRVYHDPTDGRWTLISTGIDQTFSGDQDPWGVSGVLAVKCLQEPDCEAAFAARLAEVNDRLEAMGLRERAQAIYDRVSPEVWNDPRKEVDNGWYSASVSDMLGWIDERPAVIRQILQDRGF